MKRLFKLSLGFLLIFAMLVTEAIPASVISVTPITTYAASIPKPSQNSITLYVGYKTYQVKVNNLSKNASMSFVTKNKKVAEVNNLGTITPRSVGNTNIVVKIKQNGSTFTYKIKVTVMNSYIKFTSKESQLNIGDTYTYKADAFGTNGKVTWSVSNKSIAKIDKNSGELTAISEGEVDVIATSGIITSRYTVKINVKKLTAGDIYNKCQPATVQLNVTKMSSKSVGSGFFTKSGILVTNYHVVKGASKIEVVTSSNQTYDVTTILGYDETYDIAILQINAETQFLTTAAGGVTTGETVYALGSPLGLSSTITSGIVSTASRISDGCDYIQITAPISKGNSGGPLINGVGEVVGINTLITSNGQNLNFAVNINQLNKVNINSPILAADFYKKNDEPIMITEISSKSGQSSTAQVIDNNTIVEGSLTGSDNMYDFYHFTLTESSKVTSILKAANSEDYNILSFAIVNSNIDIETYPKEDTDDNGEKYRYLYTTLPAGDYYIFVCKDKGVSKTIDYSFYLLFGN